MKVELKNGEGNTVDQKFGILPIFTIRNDIALLVGTGFFIAANGSLVTAKHVIENQGKLLRDLVAIQFLPDSKYVIRPVSNVMLHPVSDIALCFTRTPIDNETGNEMGNMVLTLTNREPQVGELVSTFAYPKSKITEDKFRQIANIETSWEFGEIVEHLPKGRDKSFLPGSTVQTSIKILSGASGGPVIDKLGRVCGVNSTGYDLANEMEKPISYFTPIKEIFDFEVPIDGNQKSTILELCKSGLIAFKE